MTNRDMDIELEKARHMTAAMDMVLGALRPSDAKPAARRYEWDLDDSSGCYWQFEADYEVDDGAVLVNVTGAWFTTHTGREIKVALNELSETWLANTIEPHIAGEIECELQAEAEAAADDDDRGDWEYEARKDRESLR